MFKTFSETTSRTWVLNNATSFYRNLLQICQGDNDDGVDYGDDNDDDDDDNDSNGDVPCMMMVMMMTITMVVIVVIKLVWMFSTWLSWL